MPTTYVNAPDGTRIPVNHPEGATSEEIIAYAKANYKPKEKGDGLDLSGEIPQVTDVEAYTQSLNDAERAYLEGQAAEAKREQASAQAKIDFAEKPAAERAVLSAAQVGADLGQVPRLILDAPTTVLNTMLGGNVSLAEELGLGDLGRGEFVPQGSASRVGTDLTATALMFGAGVAPVQRSATAGSAVADVLGLGATTESTLASQAAKVQGAIPAMHQAPELTGLARTNVDWNNPEMVQDIISDINTQTAARHYGRFTDDYNKIITRYQKTRDEMEQTLSGDELENKLEWLDKKRDQRLEVLDRKVREFDGTENPYAHGKSFGDSHTDDVVQTIARVYDIPVSDATAHVVKSGGVNAPDSFAALMKARNAQLNDDLFHTTGVTDRVFGKVQEAIRPAIALIRENVGAGVANKVEAGSVAANARRAAVVEKYDTKVEGVTELVEWADNPAIKAQFMDLHLTGVEGRAQLIGEARRTLSPQSFNVFMEAIEDTVKHQKEVQKRLLARGEKRDPVHWGINKLVKEQTYEEYQRADRLSSSIPSTIGQLATRSRKPASQMTPDELAEYDNPIVSNFNRMFEEIDMIEMSRTLDIPPSLRVGDTLQDFIKTADRYAASVTGNDRVGADFGKLLDAIIVGGRQAQSPWVTAYMNQAYAGTLGHVKSAMLQLHDQFITAYRAGARNTLASVTIDLLKKSKIEPQEFGLSTNAYNTREFREGLEEGFLANMRGAPRDARQVAADVTGKLADKYFKVSLFQTMDRLGKGGNLRATYRDIQGLAKDSKGFEKVMDKYGDLATTAEWAEVRVAMKQGTPWEELSARQRDIMGRVLVARLGQQQLISSASRPLTYLRNPLLRPLYAMRGFSIVQTDLLKADVVDEFRRGNTKDGAKALAKYLAAVVGGYIVVDTTRDLLSDAAASAISGETNPKLKDNLTLDKLGGRTFEAVAGPLTGNVIGDPYTFNRFKGNPAGTVLEAFVPPTGIVGSVSAAGLQAVMGNVDKALAEVSNAVPAIGRELSAATKLHYENDRVFQAKKRREERKKAREQRRR